MRAGRACPIPTFLSYVLRSFICLELFTSIVFMSTYLTEGTEIKVEFLRRPAAGKEASSEIKEIIAKFNAC